MSPTVTQRVADGLDRNVVQILDHVVDQAVGVDVVIVRPDFDVARRQNEVAVVDGVDHIHEAELAREQLVGVDIDHDLAVLAAERRRDFGAMHDRDLIANLELGQIVELGFVQTFALHRDQADREAGGIELQHDGRQRAGRQTFQIGQRQVGELR